MTEKNSRYIDPLTTCNYFTPFRGNRSDENPEGLNETKKQ